MKLKFFACLAMFLGLAGSGLAAEISDFSIPWYKQEAAKIREFIDIATPFEVQWLRQDGDRSIFFDIDGQENSWLTYCKPGKEPVFIIGVNGIAAVLDKNGNAVMGCMDREKLYKKALDGLLEQENEEKEFRLKIDPRL